MVFSFTVCLVSSIKFWRWVIVYVFVDNSVLMFEQEIHNDECDLGHT